MGTIDETMTPMLEVAHDVPLGTVARPLWRGRLHVHALVAVVPALAVLLTEAHGTRGRIAVAVYAIGLCSMFVASATYHRWVHTLVARDLWRRIDHAMIFAAIAGIAMKIVGWRHQRIVGGVMYIAPRPPTSAPCGPSRPDPPGAYS